MDTGEMVPYGEPATFAQRTRNRFGSNALPGPINGPHLSVENTSVAVKRNPEVSGAVHAGEQQTSTGRGRDDEMRKTEETATRTNPPRLNSQ